MRCDYVLVKLVPQPDGGVKPSFCPLKLTHHAFLQLAFNALKERCVQGCSIPDVCALHRFLSRYLLAMATFEARKRRGPAPGAAGAQPRLLRGRGGESSVGAVSRQPSEATPTVLPPQDVRPLMTADEIRTQLRAEYGVDVFSDGARLAVQKQAEARAGNPRAAEDMLPHELSEEEFLHQLSRPTGMAQECCVM